MKILFLSYYYPPDLSAGSFRAEALISGLSKIKNIDIDLLTTFPNRYENYKVKTDYLKNFKNINIHRFKTFKFKLLILSQLISFINYYFNVTKFSKNKNYDLIFCTSSRYMTAFLGSRVSKKIKSPLYTDIRDIFLDAIPEFYPKLLIFFFKPLIKYLEKCILDQSYKINLISPGFYTYYKKFYPKFNNYDFYTHGIDNIFLKYNFKKIYNSKKIQILYAGNIGKGQGLHKIIPNLSFDLKNIDFLIIGAGSEKNNLLKNLKRKNILNVKIIDPVSRIELLKYYKNTDILFLHLDDKKSNLKVIPSKIFEYACTNKPILAGVSGEIENFIKDNINNSYIFKPCDYLSAKSIILKNLFQEKSRAEFISRFNRVSICEKMIASIISTSNAK